MRRSRRPAPSTPSWAAAGRRRRPRRGCAARQGGRYHRDSRPRRLSPARSGLEPLGPDRHPRSERAKAPASAAAQVCRGQAPHGPDARPLPARPAPLAQARPGRAREESCKPERRPPPPSLPRRLHAAPPALRSGRDPAPGRATQRRAQGGGAGAGRRIGLGASDKFGAHGPRVTATRGRTHPWIPGPLA